MSSGGEGFPRCRHAGKPKRAVEARVPWLCDEPFRVFFLLGLVTSVAGVALWPLMYAPPILGVLTALWMLSGIRLRRRAGAS